MKNKSGNFSVKNKQEDRLKQLQKLAHLLDNALIIPGTSYRVGVDPLLGLIPLIGDYIGIILSSYIVWESAKLGASKTTLFKMIINLMIDLFMGIFPVLGDFFDLTWKANHQNIILLENYLKSPQTRIKTDKLFLFFMGLILIIFVIITTLITLLILKFFWGLLFPIN